LTLSLETSFISHVQASSLEKLFLKLVFKIKAEFHFLSLGLSSINFQRNRFQEPHGTIESDLATF